MPRVSPICILIINNIVFVVIAKIITLVIIIILQQQFNETLIKIECRDLPEVPISVHTA
jgi:hypothetical protein